MSNHQDGVSAEHRLTELETRLAFQDDLLEKLNEVVAQQDDALRHYQRRLQKLEDQVQQVNAQMAPEIDNAPPPHY